MKNNVKNLINKTVLEMLKKCSSNEKLKKIEAKHQAKVHFIPKKYRIFGGLLQSMNIQFGNFIEQLMDVLVRNDTKYEVLDKYSGKKSNKFTLSASNEARIDKYISRAQKPSSKDVHKKFPILLNEIIKDNSKDLNTFKHDIDLLFKNKKTNVIYYLEIKYNDDHDTGKFVDINRKFIKTYAYLVKELNITKPEQFKPILFYFCNKKMKGNIYIPENGNILRGKAFFDKFLSISYADVDNYMSGLSEGKEVLQMFDDLYKKIMARDFD